MTHDITKPGSVPSPRDDRRDDGEGDGVDPFGNGAGPLRPHDHPVGDEERGLVW